MLFGTRRRWHRAGWLATWTFVVIGSSLAAQSPATEMSREALDERVLSAPAVRAQIASGNAVVLSRSATDDKAAGAAKRGARVELLVMDRRSGRALRVVADPADGAVVAVRPLAGRPGSTATERAEAERIIRQDPTLARLLQQDGAALVGGFVTDAPEGQAASGRYLEYHLASSDRSRIEREVVVDLSRGRVAASRPDRLEEE